jgi:hypothetical protein
MKITVKKLVSLAFAAAVAASSIAASADPPDQSQPKIIVLENSDTTARLLASGPPTHSTGVNHHVNVGVSGSDPALTDDSRLPRMSAVNTVTGESYPFKTDAPTGANRFGRLMICVIPGEVKLNVEINVDVTNADGPHNTEAWWIYAAAANMTGADDMDAILRMGDMSGYWHWCSYNERTSRPLEPLRHLACMSRALQPPPRLSEQHHNVTVTTETLTQNRLQLRFRGLPEPNNQGSRHFIFASVYTDSPNIGAGNEMPRLSVEDLRTGTVWENNRIIGDGGADNPLNTPSIASDSDALNFVRAKHRRDAKLRFDMAYRVPETENLDVVLTVDVENADQPGQWYVDAQTGADNGRTGRDALCWPLPDSKIKWQGQTDRIVRGRYAF